MRIVSAVCVYCISHGICVSITIIIIVVYTYSSTAGKINMDETTSTNRPLPYFGFNYNICTHSRSLIWFHLFSTARNIIFRAATAPPGTLLPFSGKFSEQSFRVCPKSHFHSLVLCYLYLCVSVWVVWAIHILYTYKYVMRFTSNLLTTYDLNRFLFFCATKYEIPLPETHGMFCILWNTSNVPGNTHTHIHSTHRRK